MESSTNQSAQQSASPKEKPKIRFGNKYILIAIIVIIGVFAAAYAISAASGPVVVSGDYVSVFYTGRFTNGTVFDSNVGRQPLTFKVGAGQVINGFDQAVIGMHINQMKSVTIPANEAYGNVNPALFVSVPRSAFGNQTVQPGMTVTQQSQTGQQYQGTITAVNVTNVTIDFNPPLAGKTLLFNITVVSISKAS